MTNRIISLEHFFIRLYLFLELVINTVSSSVVVVEISKNFQNYSAKLQKKVNSNFRTKGLALFSFLIAPFFLGKSPIKTSK